MHIRRSLALAASTALIFTACSGSDSGQDAIVPAPGAAGAETDDTGAPDELAGADDTATTQSTAAPTTEAPETTEVAATTTEETIPDTAPDTTVEATTTTSFDHVEHHHRSAHDPARARRGSRRVRARVRVRREVRRHAQQDRRQLRRRDHHGREHPHRERHRRRDDLPRSAARHLRRQRSGRHQRVGARGRRDRRTDRRPGPGDRPAGKSSTSCSAVWASATSWSTASPVRSPVSDCAPRGLGLGLPVTLSDMEPGSDEEKVLMEADSLELPYTTALNSERWILIDRTCQIMFVGTGAQELNFVFPTSTGEAGYETPHPRSLTDLPVQPGQRQQRLAQQQPVPRARGQPAQRQHVQAALLRRRPGDPRRQHVPTTPQSKGCARLRPSDQDALLAWMGLSGETGMTDGRGVTVNVQGAFPG